MNKIDKTQIKEIDNLRNTLKSGDNVNQNQLNNCIQNLQKLKEKVLPDKKNEIFALVDKNGNPNGLTAPRWLCHLLGLRHRAVHVLLTWQSPVLGEVFILQVRSWTKSDSPGHLDISIGGHVIGDTISLPVETAYREMEEELGLKKDELINNELTIQGGYEQIDELQNKWFCNTEWRDVYKGEISTDVYEKINFKDSEVVGLYLCPKYEANNLLTQNNIPIASALKYSLPISM